VLLVTGARLGDDHGHRRLYLGGLAGFVLASLTCGLAPSAGLLVGARVVQGVAAGAMVPQVLSIIQHHFAGAARVRALGLYAAVISGGVAVGQVVGGFLIGADVLGLGWRPVFLVNVPIGLALLPLAARELPGHTATARARIDAVGVALLSASMTALVLPLILGREEGWPLWTWLSLAGAAVGLIAFVTWCRVQTARGGSPVLNLSVLANTTVRAGLLAQFMIIMTWGAFLFTLTLFLQIGHGYSAIRSGASFLVTAPPFAWASLRWSRLPARMRRWVPTFGALLAAPSYLAFGLIARYDWHFAAGAPVFALIGLCLGAAFAPLMGQTLAQVRPTEIAAASGLLTTCSQLALVIGVATLGSFYLARDASPGLALGEVTIATSVLALISAASAVVVARRSPGA
jgi:predicted MFS family arabinose efflux permease